MPEKAKMSVGIDLGGTKIAAGICSRGKILKKSIFPTNPSKGFNGIIEVINETFAQVISGYDKKLIKGVGIGSAGQIDPDSGNVIFSPNLNWHNEPLGKALSEKINLPVKVINDVRAATLAEFKYGNGKGCKNFVNIFVGTGIGSGFVLNGKLLNGVTNTAGEIGHICLDPEGPLCGCGNKGCLEAFASGTGMQNYVKKMLNSGQKSILTSMCEGDLNKIKGPMIGEAAAQGDSLALESLSRVGRYLGRALANIHTMINPEVILLGGGMMALSEYFMPELEKTIKKHILPVADRGKNLLNNARFENDAVIIGGAALF